MQVKNSRMSGLIVVALAMGILAASPGWCSDVTLKSKPSNAVVYNDQNIKQGETPLYMGPYIHSKQYQVRKKGYLPEDVTINMWSPSVIEVELQEDPNAKPEAALPTKVMRGADNNGEEVADVSADTLKRLRALKTIRDSGDISEEEYSTMRTRILDTLIPTMTPDSSRATDSSQSIDPLEVVTPRNAAATPPKPLAPIEKPRFGITCSILDDVSGNNEIIGNGDGRVQPGEVFDLVVVVTNAGDAIAQDVVCFMTLPGNQTLKSFSELHQTVESIAAGASATFRYNLAMPLNTEIAESPQCAIEVKSDASPAEYYDYKLPVEMPYPR